jgi:hypothetical protein
MRNCENEKKIITKSLPSVRRFANLILPYDPCSKVLIIQYLLFIIGFPSSSLEISTVVVSITCGESIISQIRSTEAK